MAGQQRYAIFSGYVLSEPDQNEIMKRIPNATLIWAGDQKEIEEIIRVKGKFRYLLDCPREIDPKVKKYIETKMFLRVKKVENGQSLESRAHGTGTGGNI